MRTPRLGKIHVSDLIKPCMRNVIYKKISPELGMSTEDMKSMYFGQLVHAHSQLADLEHHEKFLGYDYVEDWEEDYRPYRYINELECNANQSVTFFPYCGTFCEPPSYYAPPP